MSENSGTRPVISAASQILAHAPNMARHGSKPARELPKSQELAEKFLSSLRSFDDATGYPPHQAYLGGIHPRQMPERPRVSVRLEGASRFAPDGELMPEEELLGLMAAVDEFELIRLDPSLVSKAGETLGNHPLSKKFNFERLEASAMPAGAAMEEPRSLPLYLNGDELIGAIRTA
ncbi:MAG: hypothetical protein M3164_07875, partial [Actinomycetota bacterium]|nr:hypothetical protein [Actinomycetota bacterium]